MTDKMMVVVVNGVECLMSYQRIKGDEVPSGIKKYSIGADDDFNPDRVAGAVLSNHYGDILSKEDLSLGNFDPGFLVVTNEYKAVADFIG